MRSRRSFVVSILLTIAAGAGTNHAQCTSSGVIQRLTIGFCIETHATYGPCTLQAVTLTEMDVDLDQFQCTYVQLEGTDRSICSGETCEIIGPTTVTAAPIPCEILVPDILRIIPGSSTWFEWDAVPCADSYDVIRGNLPGPSFVGGNVNLGPVVCLMNDYPNPNNVHFQDTGIPIPGLGYFYLIRANHHIVGQPPITPYGRSSSGAQELPASGDCPQ